MSRCLRKIQLLFAKCCLCREKVPAPKTLSRGAKREKILLFVSAPCWIMKWLTQGHTKSFVPVLNLICVRKCLVWGKIWLQPECALSVLCAFWISFLLVTLLGVVDVFLVLERSFSLRLGCLQAGTSSCIQVCRKKYKGRSSLFVPSWRKMWMSCFSLIIPWFPPWCAISSQIQFRALGELCLEEGTGLAAGQEAAWAWSTLFCLIGGFGVLRSWNKPLKMFSRSKTCISGCFIWEFTSYSLVGVTFLRSWKSVAGKGIAPHPLGSMVGALTTTLSFFVHLGLNLLGKTESSGNFIKPEVPFCWVFFSPVSVS